jgi:site-specific DNA recombinase
MTALATRTARAAVYVRISDDKGGQGLGVERQREDALALVEREGWALVDVFEDNDISAFSGKARPGYLALVEAISGGRVDVVVAWHPDRLHRAPRELEDWIDLLDRTGATVATVKAGRYDLGTPSGRQIARILGAVARGESEHKRDRIRRAMVQNAERGLVQGPTRTYGLDGTRRRADGSRDWVIVEDEAAVIREAADRVLAGEAMHAIMCDLNARGVPAPKGGRWSVQSLKNILISPRVAGWREHKPGRDRDEPTAFGGGEFTARAEWPAILDRVLVERLRRILGDPARRRGPNGRTYLLSGGLGKCAECGGNLAGQATGGGRRAYRCSVAGGGCGRVMIGADGLEAFVIEAVREAHTSGRFDAEVRDAGADNGADEAWALVAELRAELDDNAADKAARRITREQFLTLNDATLASLAGRQEREASALLAGGLAEFDRAWALDEAAGDLSRMRARLSAALVSVTVSRAVPGRNRFDPARVTPEWRA